MKKVLTGFITIIILFTITNVYADEAYSILIDENNNFTLKDSSNNPVTDNSIAKYENNTLTLGENTAFNEIKTKHDLTITSNDKEVSIKNLTTKEEDTYLPVNVNLNKLKVKDDETYYFQVDVGGNLIVKNSETNSQKDTEVKGYIDIKDSKIKNINSINSRGSNDDEYGLIITNSEITSDNQIRPDNGGSYFKDSKLNVKYISAKGDLIIENCEINTTYLSQNKDGDYKVNIKDSTIKNSGQIALYSTGIDNVMIIENSTIECSALSGTTAYSGRIPANLKINNSNITIKYMIKNFGEFISIENSDLTVEGISNNKKIIISNSNINATGNWIYSDLVEIYNSQLSIDDRIQTKKLLVEDSEIRAYYYFIVENTTSTEEYDVIIKNSKITTDKNRSTFYNTLVENSEFNILKGISIKDNIKFKNSKGQINEGITINNNLILEDSVLKIKDEEYDGVALFVENDLNIKNSNIIIDNNTIDKVAAIVKNNVVLDDRIVPIDDSKTILKVKELTKEEIIALMPNYGSRIADNTNVKIFTYNDDSFSKYVQLATTKTISFRVKNGTWLDGTTDDIKLDYLYGEKIDVENLPEEVKKLLTSKMGEWSVDLYNLDPTKDQEIEFRYNIVNPETATNFILLTSILTLIIIMIYKTRKKELIKQ